MRRAAAPAGAGAAAVAAYLGVVVATTPALAPADAAWAALQINPAVIAGTGAGVALQVHLSGVARRAGCARRRHAGGSAGGAAATSFFSFFSLVPLGCCGWWLYALSLLPGVLGAGASAALIEHSALLAYLGLAAVFGMCAASALRLRARGLLRGPALRRPRRRPLPRS